MVLSNAALLFCEAVLYFAVLATLFRLRHRFGFGVFVAALGAMHFLETYLAALLYVDFPGGITFSPGSTILFAGKLAMLLLVYIREDATAVRQPIYGLLIGNFLMVALVVLMRQHDQLLPVAERPADFALMDDMGWLMVWGTVLLFIDAIAMILLYERSGRWLGKRVLLRVWLSLAAVLTFDQVGFFLALHFALDAPPTVLYGGWVGKMFAAITYSLLVMLYLRYFERRSESGGDRKLGDVFEILTYRERYEALLRRTGRDGLTGLLDHGSLDEDGPRLLREAGKDGRSTSILMIDVDHFKTINDRLGHLAGDNILRQVAQRFVQLTREGDQVYRYGGEEFVLVCRGLAHGPALLIAERLRRDISASTAQNGTTVTISIGVATSPEDGSDFGALIDAADKRLYQAKAEGRDRVVGRPAEGEPSAEERQSAAG